MNKSIEEAKALMCPDAIDNLKHVISTQEKIDMSKKVNGDAIMVALCKSINDELIKVSSLSSTLIKMLNSSTNTISQSKLGEILDQVRKSQPNIICVMKLTTGDMTNVINTWRFDTSDSCHFNEMFEFVVSYFGITPQMVREKLSKLLKPTIANNIGQFLVKYDMSKHKEELVVSITTIARLVNMENHILRVEFIEEA
jgi:hypothetical protein